MRKILLLTLGLIPSALFAQQAAKSSTPIKNGTKKQVLVSAKSMQAQDAACIAATAKSNHQGGRAKSASTVGTVIGNSYYDLQSNASVQRRVLKYNTGGVSATWTFAPVADSGSTTFDNRGTGYNYYNGTTWNAIPTARQEASTRTGWPALVVNKAGNEVIETHTAASTTVYHNHQLKNTAAGSTTWTEANVTANATDIWTRTAAASDANHNNIYMIDASQDTTYVHSGCTTKQPVLYSRSTDGGATWSTDHILIPGFPCGRYGRNGGDDYFIDAKDSIVAIVIGGTGKDVTLFKSTDWGTTFTNVKCDSFPVAAYDGGSINIGNGVNADTIKTNDGNVTCLIDNWGKVHVWWGYYWLMGSTTAGSWSFFPLASSKLVYWNEYGKKSTIIDDLLTGFHDCDASGSINTGTAYDLNGTNTQDALYRAGMISMPQAGIDAAGNIYVVYSTVMENDTTGPGNSMGTPVSQPYRDLFMMYLKPDVTGNTYDSAFGGLFSSHSTWSFPVNITKTPGYEDAFPSMARNVDANAYITWQEDMEPGTNLINGDPCSVNYIKYMALDITQFQSDAAVATNACQTTVLAAPNAAFDTASLATNRCTWTFTDISTPTPNSYLWTFPADATPSTSTAKNPTVHFANGGNHIIKLDVANQSGTSHLQKTIVVNASGCVNGIDDVLDAQSVNIYPNPSNGMLNVSFNNLNADHATITVENMLGQQIAAVEAQAIHNGSAFNFNIQNQAAGVYFVKISTEKGSLTQKVVLEK